MSLTRRACISDGKQWTCKECRKNVSIRAGSFFQNSKLKLTQILDIVYGWAREHPQYEAARDAKLGERSTHTIVDWYNFCRDITEQHLVDNPTQVGGFDENTLLSKTVEIDESKFFHRKYHRGQWREGHWVFGGIERGSGNCFLVEVPDRTENTLTPIIERYVLPGTIIISDGWRAYRNINQIGGGIYEHEVITHEENFVNPDDPTIHTQNVENMWMRAKRKLKRQCGTSEALFTSYLHEFIWRNKFKSRDIFSALLVCVREQYPVW
nr:uncharacterized protein LOC111415684 [Onthophagus taurus]